MKVTKILLCVLITILLASNAMALDFLVEGRAYVPRMSEFHTNSPGTTVTAIHWLPTKDYANNGQLGVGVSAGWEHWGINEGGQTVPISGGQMRVHAEGSNDFFPLGLHGFWKFTSKKPFNKADWIVSLGAEYILNDVGTEVPYDWRHDTNGSQLQGDFDVNIQDTWAIVLGVMYVKPWVEKEDLVTSLVLGAGYRRTIGRGTISVPDLGYEKWNDMNAFFFRAGLLFETR